MDFLLDDNYSPICENGDFVTGDDLEQRQRLLLATNPGDWKQNPMIGVGVVNWLNDENIVGLKSEIKRQLIADGLKVKQVVFINGELLLDVERG